MNWSNVRVLLVVVVAIGLWLWIVVGGFGSRSNRTPKIDETRRDLLTLGRAIDSYMRLKKTCPSVETWFGQLLPFTDTVVSRSDPWGCPYEYRPGRDWVGVVSPGPDRKLGTDDDITFYTEVPFGSGVRGKSPKATNRLGAEEHACPR